MRVKSIRIIVELDESDNGEHATEMVFSDGLWKFNGPVYSRIGEACHEVWKLIRQSFLGTL